MRRSGAYVLAKSVGIALGLQVYNRSHFITVVCHVPNSIRITCDHDIVLT